MRVKSRKDDATVKELKQYQCEHCGAIYNNKDKAKKCEKSHKVNAEFHKMSYRSVYEDESGYPMYIEVKFEDGKVVKYKKCGVVNNYYNYNPF